MKKLFYMITTVAIAASFASCNKIEQDNNTTPVETPAVNGTTTLTISATSPQTKTYLVDNADKTAKNTNWTKGDVVTLFGLEDKTVTATASNAGNASATVDFTFAGWPAAITPAYLVFDGPLAEQAENNSVVSPIYNEDGTITATVRSLQVITNKGNMSKYANLSIGKVEEIEGTYNTVMRNVCGLIKFELGGDETSVEDVLIKDALGNPMTGLVKVDYNEGQPVVVEVVEPADYVQVKANITNYNNKMLEGVYYACVLPGTYSPEITINHTDGSVTTLKMPENQTVTIERSQIFDFTTIYDPTPETGEGDEPEGDPIVLTVDMTPKEAGDTYFNPFEEGLKTSAEDEELTYTLKGTEYTFVLYRAYRNAGNLRVTGSGLGYIKFPEIADFKLSKINITGSNGANAKDYYICTSKPTLNNESKLADYDQTFKLTNNDPTDVTISDSEAGVGYYLASIAKNAQFTKLVLTYTPAN